MFRRKWSALPQDLMFGDNLADLGYSINEDDEVRSLEDSNRYFRYFISKSERVNERQRFHFNDAIRTIIYNRLTAEGLETVRLPLTVTSPNEQHIPILVSKDINKATRVVLFLGESTQPLGTLAYRTVNGRGGINKGSLVSVVQDIKKQKATRDDDSPPGIIIANLGEAWWWPEGKRTLTVSMMQGLPLASAVHIGRDFDEVVNCVQQLETPKRHMRYLLDTVVPTLINKDALLDVIAVGDASLSLLSNLENEKIWAQHKSRLNAGAFMGITFNKPSSGYQELSAFLENRCRCWVVNPDYTEQNTPLAGPEGNSFLDIPNDIGCPVFASGEKYYLETALCHCREHVTAFLQEVALDRNYKNPVITNIPSGTSPTEDANDPWNSKTSEDLVKALEAPDEFKGKRSAVVAETLIADYNGEDGWSKFVQKHTQKREMQEL